MCIAILQPKNKMLKKKTLKNCWDNNPDGAGFMYAYKSEVVIVKELTDFNSFYSQFRKHREKHNTNFVIHFRIATHGKVDIRNTHPHKVNELTWLVHNGIISQKSFVNARFSDTVKFTKLLGNLPLDFMDNPSILELIKDYIDSDKMIFLNNEGKIKIINQSSGVKKWGCWFSNSTFNHHNYKVYKPFTYGNYSTYDTHSNTWRDYNYNQDDGTYTNKEGFILGVDFEQCETCSTDVLVNEFDSYGGKCMNCATDEWGETEDKAKQGTELAKSSGRI